MIRIESLVINITDICNMECPFCLRGDRGSRKIDLSLLPRIFEGIDEIDDLTISGGEPGCNIEAVKAIVDYLVTHKDTIHVRGFFIVTNGKEYHQELVDAVKTMLFLHLEKDYNMNKMIAGHKDAKAYTCSLEEEHYMFGLAVSMDDFHEPIPLANWMKYHMSGVYSDVKESDFSKGGVIARGRGAGLPNSYDRDYRELYVEEEDSDIIANEVYVSLEGHIYGDCDMSYEMEQYMEPYGSLADETLAEILRKNVRNE